MISTNEQVAAVVAFVGGFAVMIILIYAMAFLRWMRKGIVRWWERETSWIGDLKRLIELAFSPSVSEERIHNHQRRRKARYDELLS